MKFISLFAGVGGFDLALERLGHECVYANDIDKNCKIIYDKHFTNKLDCRSITDVRADEIPNHDLLCGGFPCQPFSIAGKKQGFGDTRGNLFYEITRILNTKRPSYILLENVRNLLTHDNGRTFKTILRALDELGYECEWQICNSKNYGACQKRERLIIVGNHRRVGQRRIYYTPTNGVVCENPAVTVTARGYGSQRNGTYVVTHSKIRKLTPVEIERLQTFPNNWTDGISTTGRYKAMGNAVTVNVIYEIAKLLPINTKK